MLAPGADKVRRQGISLVHITADGADPALFLLFFGLDIALIIGVGAGGLVAEHHRVSHLTDKQRVAPQVHLVHHPAVHGHVGPTGEVKQVICPSLYIGKALKLVHLPAGLHPKAPEEIEGGRGGDAADGKHAGANDHIVGQVLLLHGKSKTGWVVCRLDGGIDDAAVIPSLLPGCEEKKPVGQLIKRFLIHRNLRKPR